MSDPLGLLIAIGCGLFLPLTFAAVWLVMAWREKRPPRG